MTSPVVFVTGGTGLVGSHLLYDLLQKDYRVKALKRPSSNTSRVLQTFGFYSDDAESLFGKIEWVEADLFCFESISNALNECNAVYHAAAIVSFGDSGKAQMLQTNVEGTANIVNVCLEKQIPLCFASSIGALGHSEPGVAATEKTLWQTANGRSTYAYSKYKAEMEVWRGIAEGLQATIVNPSIILGPGDWTKGSLKFFPQVYKGMRFYTQGVTAFVDVRDVSRCMISLMEQKCFGERYILSSGELSYRELFNLIADGLNVKRPSVEVKPWMAGIALRLARLAGILTGKEPALTKETIRSAFQKHSYSNEKVKKALDCEFIPVKKSIKDCCRIFLQSCFLPAIQGEK